jgi:DnaJ-class molecular chaperone
MSLMFNSPPDDCDDDDSCPKCGTGDREWVTCWSCHGEGCFDMHEEDGVNYAEGEELETCSECGGHGGWLECYECQRRAIEASK